MNGSIKNHKKNSSLISFFIINEKKNTLENAEQIRGSEERRKEIKREIELGTKIKQLNQVTFVFIVELFGVY
jgi:hypothetical protein